MKCLRILSLAVAGALLLSSGAALAKKPVPISSCDTIIGEPGRYFVTEDLFCVGDEQGISILASDVTLDLKGHTITCNSDPDVPKTVLVGAVLVGAWPYAGIEPENVTVKNGIATNCDDGVIYFWTTGGTVKNIESYGNVSGGVALIVSTGITVKNNTATGNGNGIGSYMGTANTYAHNTVSGNSNGGIDVWGEWDSTIKCNQSAWNSFGISLGPFSMRNTVKGNYVENTFVVGVNLWGWRYMEWYEDVPSNNLVTKNKVNMGGFNDLDEVVFDAYNGWPYVDYDLGCQNTWVKNEYASAAGPDNCFAPSVILDDDDVCALDDDDESDSDSDSD